MLEASSLLRIRIGQTLVDLGTRAVGPASDPPESHDRLEPKPLEVLRALALAWPEPLTKDELLDHAWPGTYVSDAAVYRAISLVRGAIGGDGQGSFVESVPKTGYRLRVQPVLEYASRIGDEGSSQATQPDRRVAVVVEITPTADFDRLHALSADVVAHLGWAGRAFQVLRRAHASTTPDCFRCALRSMRNGDELGIEWEITVGPEGEFIGSGRHTEPLDKYETTRARIADHLAQSVEEAIRGHVHSHASELGPGTEATWGYWTLLLLADRHRSNHNDDVALRRERLTRAVELRPEFASGHAALADLVSWLIVEGRTGTPRGQAERVRECVAAAMERERNDPYVLAKCGAALARIGDHARGLALTRRACDLAPTAAHRERLAISLTFSGFAEEALTHLRELERTTPQGHAIHYGKWVVPLLQLGAFEDAVTYGFRAVTHFPADYYAWCLYASALGAVRQDREAVVAFREALRLEPRLTLGGVISSTERTYGRDDNQRERVVRGLRRISPLLR